MDRGPWRWECRLGLCGYFWKWQKVYYTHDYSGKHYATRLNSNGSVTNWSWSRGHGVGTTGWMMADIFQKGRMVYTSHDKNGNHYATQLNEDGTVKNWTWRDGQGLGNAGWSLISNPF